jgi:hypothetical protein
LLVVFRDRDCEVGIGARICLARAQLPPLDFNQRPSPRPRFDRAQPLPDHVFDVVLEQHDGDAATHRHIRSGKEKIRNAKIDVSLVHQIADLALH